MSAQLPTSVTKLPICRRGSGGTVFGGWVSPSLADPVLERNIVEFATDALREVVDSYGFLLPNDRELLLEWQGQNYTIVKSAGNPYGKREYSQGKFHTLTAGKMMIAAKRLQLLDELLTAKPAHKPVLDVFVGARY